MLIDIMTIFTTVSRDGEMVEVVEEDRQPETEAVDSYERVDSDRMIRCLSPHSSQVEEALDYVTIECFTTIVVPLVRVITRLR